MAKMTGGQAMVESLKAQGVDTVFGIISVHTLDLYDALFDSQESLRFIGGRQELGCGFMADGYARRRRLGWGRGRSLLFQFPLVGDNHQRRKGVPERGQVGHP